MARVQWDVVTQLGGRYPRLPRVGTKVFEAVMADENGGVRRESRRCPHPVPLDGRLSWVSGAHRRRAVHHYHGGGGKGQGGL